MAVKRREVLRFAGVGLAAAAATAFTPIPARAQAPAAVPRGTQILLRSGYVVTLDPQLGDLRGDVLIDAGRIVAVGKNLDATSAQVVDASGLIVLPGFVDSHRHLWQSSLRFIGPHVPPCPSVHVANIVLPSDSSTVVG